MIRRGFVERKAIANLENLRRERAPLENKHRAAGGGDVHGKTAIAKAGDVARWRDRDGLRKFEVLQCGAGARRKWVGGRGLGVEERMDSKRDGGNGARYEEMARKAGIVTGDGNEKESGRERGGE
jgi:hypothetical protein